MPLFRLSALVLMAALAAGCGRAHLFYDARELRHPAFSPQQRAALAQTVARAYEGRQIVVVQDGAERAVSPTVPALAALDVAVLGALWLAKEGGEQGGENDVRVHVGKREVAVSVWTDLQGNTRVEMANDTPAVAERLTEEQVRARHGLQAPLPGRWGEEELQALDAALALLSPVELDVVRAVPFRRTPAPRGSPALRAALYEQNGCTATITLFPSGVASDRYRFIGDATAPRSAVLHSLLHEIGHAIEQAPSRAAYCAAEKKRRVEEKNPLVAEGNRLVHDSPVVAAYLAVLAGLPAPTDYGNESRHESFAESFALARVDPKALARTRPSVARWFAAGGHLDAVGPPRS
jgi:hypothetical protein